MDKNTALAYANNGKRITHHYFTDSEYLEVKGGKLQTEEGYEVTNEFWQLRTGQEWQQDWPLFGESSTSTEHTAKEVGEGFTPGEDLEVIQQAVYRAYEYLVASGHFTTPTETARILENYLIQARVRVMEVKNQYPTLHADNKALKELLKWVVNEIETTPDELSDALLGLIKIKSNQLLNRLNK